MDPRYAPFNITTAVALVLTLWVMVARARGARESNWPLVYYLGIVLYSYQYPGYLEPRLIYAGVLAGLFLRFEFMGRGFARFVQAVEFIILGLFIYAFARIIRI
jgi:hypothetical protein